MKTEFVIDTFDDEELVIRCMEKYCSPTKVNDDQVFRNMENVCYGVYLESNMVAFACIIRYKGIHLLGYTWNEGSWTSKKAYAVLANYIDKKYQYLKLGIADRYNKAQRRNSR